jgi:hypothetical protein
MPLAVPVAAKLPKALGKTPLAGSHLRASFPPNDRECGGRASDVDATRDRPFQKGRNKVGGRRKGTPNRSTTEVKMWAQACFANPRWRRAIMKLMVAGKAPATVQYILMLLGGRPKNVVEVQSDTQPSAGDQFAEQLLEGMTPDQIAPVADDARRRCSNVRPGSR